MILLKVLKKADSEVLAKLKNYKRKLIPGTEDYDLFIIDYMKKELTKEDYYNMQKYGYI